MKVAVAGATGRVGRHIVDILEARGHHAIRISRSEGVDIISGEGLDAALAGVEAVIDAATGPSPDKDESIAFFTTAARNLHEAGERAGVQRLVTVSIIGIDDFVGGYSAGKLAHEQAALAGPIPTRVVRAAQFHEFVGQLVEWGTQGAVAYVPKFRTQLVAARSVARRSSTSPRRPTSRRIKRPRTVRSSRSPDRARRASWRWPNCSSPTATTA